ncbi:MAG: UDP-2,3-diacylglucosamine diphosphatase LpxI [Lentisphaerae bacterium]|nr:UDP-2,3-diacylglucosamine diphosphatase LpxI [Lentisphaerota bacterium]
MHEAAPERFSLIAGRGDYPRLLAEQARQRGVSHIHLVAFKGETPRSLAACADRVDWIHLGQVGRMIDALRSAGTHHAIMAGQVSPTAIFRVRPDAWARQALMTLGIKNPHTVFGMVVAEIAKLGIEVLPASTFMEAYMPPAGLLTVRAPTAREEADITLGLDIARTTTGLEIGQTVVIKEGIILAVEALEGTDRTIRRAGRLGGRGSVVIKIAKQGQDMRFDIPVIGRRTLKMLKQSGATCLAFGGGKAILLEKDRLVEQADRQGLTIIGMDTEG